MWFVKKPFVYILYIVLGLLVFGNSLANSFVSDDINLNFQNSNVFRIGNIPMLLFEGFRTETGSGGYSSFYYKPLPFITLSVVGSLFGSSPYSYRMFQILFHITTAIFLFEFLYLFFPNFIAIGIGLLFLVHPLNTEPVIYISAMQDTLVLFFGMASVLFYRKARTILSYAVMSLLLLASFLSKETGLIFGIVLIFYEVLILKSRKFLITLLRLLPVYVVYFCMRLYANSVSVYGSLLSAPMNRTSLLERLYLIPKIILYYIGTFFAPFRLVFSQHWLVRSLTVRDFYIPLVLSVLFVFFILFAGFSLYRHSRKYFGIYLFFCLWFIAGLLPHLQIIPLDMTAADRWFYIPMVGLLGMISCLVYVYFWHERMKKIYVVCMTVIIVVFSIRTITRTFDWRNNFTLATHDIVLSKESHDLAITLGLEYYVRNDYPQAIRYFTLATEIQPTYWRAWNNLGGTYLKSGNRTEAEKCFRTAIAHNPLSVYPYLNLIQIVDDTNIEEAKLLTQEALSKFPQDPNLWKQLAAIEEKMGKSHYAQLAMQQYRILIQESRTQSASTFNLSSDIPLQP